MIADHLYDPPRRVLLPPGDDCRFGHFSTLRSGDLVMCRVCWCSWRADDTVRARVQVVLVLGAVALAIAVARVVT